MGVFRHKLKVIVASDRAFIDPSIDKVLPLVKRIGEKHELQVEGVVVPNDKRRIRLEVLKAVGECDAILVAGGTGPSTRDVTVEAVKPLLDRELPGFGELFRMLSYKDVEARSLLSRALAGVIEETPVFITPGSPKAVELALTHLVLPVLNHLTEILRYHVTEWKEEPVKIVDKITQERALVFLKTVLEQPHPATAILIGKVKHMKNGREVKEFEIKVDKDKISQELNAIEEKGNVKVKALIAANQRLKPGEIIAIFVAQGENRHVALEAVKEAVNKFKQIAEHKDYFQV